MIEVAPEERSIPHRSCRNRRRRQPGFDVEPALMREDLDQREVSRQDDLVRILSSQAASA
jgi:hypothetical protein